MLEKYRQKLRKINYSKGTNNDNNLSFHFPQNMYTVNDNEFSEPQSITKESFFNMNSAKIQKEIHDNTQEFNQMMEEQYQQFDFSYYYVDSSTKFQVKAF